MPNGEKIAPALNTGSAMEFLCLFFYKEYLSCCCFCFAAFFHCCRKRTKQLQSGDLMVVLDRNRNKVGVQILATRWWYGPSKQRWSWLQDVAPLIFDPPLQRWLIQGQKLSYSVNTFNHDTKFIVFRNIKMTDLQCVWYVWSRLIKWDRVCVCDQIQNWKQQEAQRV